MPNTLGLVFLKKNYPAFKEMDDHSFMSALTNMVANPTRSKHILLNEKVSEMHSNSNSQAVLETFRLPEGWGGFLRSFTDRIIDGISEGMPLTAISAIAGDPQLTLLLQIVQIYALFLDSSKRNMNYSVVTRQDAREILQENAHLGALASNAQELLNLFGLLTKLRHGETRLHQRIIDSVKRMLLAIEEW